MVESLHSDADTGGKEEVYGRLGAIVRSLHDALRELGAEQVLAEAASEFPSARERLLHIGRLTEKAANTVLNKVEEATPIQDRLAAEAEKLAGDWKSADVPAELRPLADSTSAFLAGVQDGCNTTRAGLSDMMMAQDFQDLTGQLIKKVVVVLERTEKDLLNLLLDAAPEGTVSEVKKEEMMAGPGAVGGVALDQGDVDDLLADLGF
jgi:chemotaxis protein CheZ